jgi:PAS domain S-box-containing protein
MNPFSLISFAAALLALALGGYALALDRRSPLNRSFSFVAVLVAFWAVGYTFLYPDAARESAWFWYRVSGIGWVLVPAAVLRFARLLTGCSRQRWLTAVLFVPAFALLCQLFSGVLVATDFRVGSWGTVEVHDPAALPYVVYTLYNFGYFTAAFLLVARWGRRNGVAPHERRQARDFVIGFLITFLSVILLNVVVPLSGLAWPALGVGTTMIATLGMWRAITRHRLFRISTGIAADEVIARMLDLFLLLDTGGRIVRVNPPVARLFGRTPGELAGIPFPDMVVERDVAWKMHQRIATQVPRVAGEREAGGSQFPAYLRAAGGEPVPVTVSWSAVRGPDGDAAGSVVVAHDMRGTLQLEAEIGERRRAEQALQGALGELRTKHGELARHTAAMERELYLARSIQRGLLPAHPLWQGIAAHYQPMHTLGGDFYDFIRFPDPDRIGVFLSDVSGQGVPAALISAMLKSLLLQNAPGNGDPADVLGSLNRVLCDQTGGTFITAFYGICDAGRNEFVYALAGHPAPYRVPGDGSPPVRLTSAGRGLPLGMFPGETIARLQHPYRATRVSLTPGERIFVFTDGLSEAAPVEDGPGFEDEGLLDALSSVAGEPGYTIVETVAARLRAYHGGDQFEDDVCFLAFGPDDRFAAPLRKG